MNLLRHAAWKANEYETQGNALGNNVIMECALKGQKQGCYWFLMLLLFQSGTYLPLTSQGVAPSSLALGLARVGPSGRGAFHGLLDYFYVCIAKLLRHAAWKANEHRAQGNALGSNIMKKYALKGQKQEWCWFSPQGSCTLYSVLCTLKIVLCTLKNRKILFTFFNKIDKYQKIQNFNNY